MSDLDQLTIEEILVEASAYGLRNEVAKLAHEFKHWDGHSDIEAYKLAFDAILSVHN